MDINDEDAMIFDDNSYFFNIGNHRKAYTFLGSHKATRMGRTGYQFRVWAPRCTAVYLQGDFNDWALLPMEHHVSGIWSVFVEGAKAGQCYKYGIEDNLGNITYKMDPFGFRFELPPKDATVIHDLNPFEWTDQHWQTLQEQSSLDENPLQIYEVHASSWRRHSDGSAYTFVELADTLIPYVKQMGYTHIEFLPLMDHPLAASWGYQITGFYAFNALYGKPEELQYFVNKAHKEGIGVFLDWVPGHFSRNAYALAYFDGTPTFEFEDNNRANNVGWGTLNFDLGKSQVQSYLISNALFWLKEFHFDGIRVDAVSNMLYLDFDQGPWTPNEDGSNVNREGVAFIKKLNQSIKEECPHATMMAEESTDWDGVTRAVEENGLGFDYKWNMGWMNDTLKFFEMDPLYRPANLRLITFTFVYQFNERYILPLSHDEVVHGKKSLLHKMPGDRWNQFANLRVLFAYMLAQPGKQLHFMGNEFGQFIEWRYYSELEWRDLDQELNPEFQHFVATLNQLGQAEPALHVWDHSWEGITILNADDLTEGVLTFIRHGKEAQDDIVVICNFTPVQRDRVRVGVQQNGTYYPILNTAMKTFGGSWTKNLSPVVSETIAHDNQEYSIELLVPGLSVIFLKVDADPVLQENVVSSDVRNKQKTAIRKESVHKQEVDARNIKNEK